MCQRVSFVLDGHVEDLFGVSTLALLVTQYLGKHFVPTKYLRSFFVFAIPQKLRRTLLCP